MKDDVCLQTISLSLSSKFLQLPPFSVSYQHRPFLHTQGIILPCFMLVNAASVKVRVVHVMEKKGRVGGDTYLRLGECLLMFHEVQV